MGRLRDGFGRPAFSYFNSVRHFTKCLTIRAVRSKIKKNGQKNQKKKVLSEFDVKGEYKWVNILEQMASVERQMRI